MAGGHPLQPLLHGDPLNATDVDLAALADKIGHTFGRAELAAEALTHRGALDRRSDLKTAFPHGNERLEFLGDRVLSLAVADLLLRRFPQEHEGELARRHAALVRAETLVEIATTVGLGADIRLGESERGQSDGVRPTILADALEALLGAVFLDAGFAVSAACVERLWGDRLTSQAAAPRDPKTALQEWAQARGMTPPAYEATDREGPDHAPVFTVRVSLANGEAEVAKAGTKRLAEQQAARALLARMEAGAG